MVFIFLDKTCHPQLQNFDPTVNPFLSTRQQKNTVFYTKNWVFYFKVTSHTLVKKHRNIYKNYGDFIQKTL